jgi:hypothetical protein
MTIRIVNPADWDRLRKMGLTTVLDPMIFRCGELFLKEKLKGDARDETWDLLSKNTGALAMFFDYLILANGRSDCSRWCTGQTCLVNRAKALQSAEPRKCH